MRRFLVPGVVTAVAAGLIVLLAFGVLNLGTSNSLTNELARGEHPIAPEAHLEMPMLDGHGSVSLASLRGKVVLVNMFASWCETCQAEQPLIEWAEKTLRRHDGTVLGINYGDNGPADLAYGKRYGLTYPLLGDANKTFADAYGTAGVPETYIIGRNGRIVAIDRGEETKGSLDRTLEQALAG